MKDYINEVFENNGPCETAWLDSIVLEWKQTENHEKAQAIPVAQIQNRQLEEWISGLDLTHKKSLMCYYHIAITSWSVVHTKPCKWPVSYCLWHALLFL